MPTGEDLAEFPKVERRVVPLDMNEITLALQNMFALVQIAK